MAGLIQQGMAKEPNSPQMPQAPQGAQVDADSDPGYTQALSFAMQALYGDKAVVDVAKSLKTGDPVDALANTAYEIVSIVDERTDGAVPDELLVLFATKILEEVADIAEAAGVEVKGSTVALALKQMILRYLGEQGVDASQLQQAMDQVDPAEFDKAADDEGAESPAQQAAETEPQE